MDSFVQTKKASAASRTRFWLILEILTVSGVLVFYLGVVRPYFARAELNGRLLKSLKVCRGNADLEVVRGLLKQGASPNAVDTEKDSLSALTVASGGGYPPVVQLRVDSGAKVNVKGTIFPDSSSNSDGLDGITPLWMAAFSGNATVCKILLDHGADIHAVDSRGASIILDARSDDVVQLLLDRGLDINARDKDGFTLLLLSALAYGSGNPHSFSARAAGSGMPDIAFLLTHGADPNVTARHGLTPLKLVRGRPDLVALLKAAGATQ